MTVFVCIDDKGGMTFNNRRQSRDSSVLEDIKRVSGDRLFATSFSEKLLCAADVRAKITDSPLDEAGEGDFVFIENLPLLPHLERIEKIIIYRWNRHYPSDRRIDVEPTKNGFRLKSRREFVGTSHDMITREDYVR